MGYETLLYDVKGAVATITLNRPEAANALDLAMCRELQEAALAAREDAAVRAVVIGARGRLFCSGGDLSAFGEAGEGAPRLLRQMTLHLHAAVALLARMDAPVVAAVGGTAAGAGFSLAAACDLVVAAESAKFAMAYTRAGLSPDGSSTWFLPRLIGRRRTLELMLTNRPLDAAEALEWGIVSQVVPDGEADAAAAELAGRLAQGPTRAFGVVKKLVLESGGHGLETQMELESEGIAAASASEDGREGVAAFLGKRAPAFRGV